MFISNTHLVDYPRLLNDVRSMIANQPVEAWLQADNKQVGQLVEQFFLPCLQHGLEQQLLIIPTLDAIQDILSKPHWPTSLSANIPSFHDALTRLLNVVENCLEKASRDDKTDQHSGRITDDNNSTKAQIAQDNKSKKDKCHVQEDHDDVQLNTINDKCRGLMHALLTYHITIFFLCTECLIYTRVLTHGLLCLYPSRNDCIPVQVYEESIMNDKHLDNSWSQAILKIFNHKWVILSYSWSY